MRIVGFGACMISGYPLPEEKGFFSRFTHALHLPGETQAEVASLPGTTAPRAARLLRRKLLPLHPDLVVLQFGSTDCDCPPVAPLSLGQRTPKKGKPKSAAPEGKTAGAPLHSPTTMDRMRWLIASLLGLLFIASPHVPLDTYLDAMSNMVDTLGDEGVPVILLSPFPFAMARTQFWTRRFTKALKQRFGERPGVLVVDCLAPFAGRKPRDILLSDGFHLSETGHEVLAGHIAREAEAFILRTAREDNAHHCGS